jgi:AraC-like DNA-binding protein
VTHNGSEAAYQVEVDGDEVRVTMSRAEALAVAKVLRSEAGNYGVSSLEKGRLRAIAAAIGRATRPKKRVYNKIPRPSSDFSSPIDMEHVLYGGPPWPTLSMNDMNAVYPQLVAQGLKPREIARRLYLNERTVYRRFKAAREAEEQ